MLKKVHLTEYNRWLVIFGTALVQLGVGTFYAWSIFNTPILKMFGELTLDDAGNVAAIQPHLGPVSLIFSIGSLSLALSTIFVGKLVRKFGIRRVTMLAGLVFGLSTFGVSRLNSPSQLLWYYILAGVLLGAADGIAYMATLTNAIKWFPENTGFISGISIAFYGLGSFVFKYIDSAFLGSDIVRNLPRALMGWGGLVTVLILIGSLFLRDAPDTPLKNSVNQHQYTPLEVLHMPQAYLLFATLFTISISVYLTGIATNLGTNLAGLSVSRATTVVALIAISNTIGRFVIGTLSDWFGRKTMLILSYSATLIAVLVLTLSNQLSAPVFYAMMMMIGFFFGGTITVFPSLVGDYFGLKNHSQNYAIIYQGFGFGSLAGAVILSLAGGNLFFVFYTYIVLLIMSLLIWILIRKPLHKE
jgi:Nitrate/nitrite transporter